MTKVTFETAALADALSNAAKVAPTRGASFERCAGVFLDVTAEECIVMATDDQVRYSTWLTPEAVEGDRVKWRIPSQIFTNVVSKLKASSSRTLTLEQDGKTIKLVHGKTRALFRLIDIAYPVWTPFSPDDMKEVTGLSKAVQSVVWAAAKNGDPPLIAVHLDGEFALATDRYRFASAPCPLPLDAPITIPPAAITGVLRNAQTVMVRIEGNQIYVMPDEFTQVAMTAYGVAYPPIQTLMRREFPFSVKVNKQSLLDAIDLVLPMVGSDRSPTIILIFGCQQLAVMIQNQEEGRAGHIIDTPGQLDFPSRKEIRFNPDNLLGALNASPGNEVTLGFDPEKPKGAMYVDGGGEQLEFWLAPRGKSEPGAE